MQEEKVRIPIPEGFESEIDSADGGMVCVPKSVINKGFVIRHAIYGDFVWVLVEEKNFKKTQFDKMYTYWSHIEKYGTACNYWGLNEEDNFGYCETDDLKKQKISIKKYGGYYISRCHISQDANGKPQSRKGFLPWVEIKYQEAFEISKFIQQADVSSHLILGEEFDCMLNFCKGDMVRYHNLITEDCIDLGNMDWTASRFDENLIKMTGSNEEWKSRNIYDWIGNVYSWTQEKSHFLGNYAPCYYVRGASFKERHPPGNRVQCGPNEARDDIGFRVCLTIE